MTVELPEGWREVALGEIVASIRQAHRPSSNETYELWSIPSFAGGRPEIVSGEEIKSGKLTVQAGDVLVSKINPRINRVWQVGSARGLPQIASTEWLVARIKGADECTPNFLQNCLSAPRFRAWISSAASSVTGSHMRAKTNQILEQKVSLPPLSEQHRIVEILEEQFSRLDSALASVKAVREKAQSFRRSLLHAAFSGELTGGTEGWRGPLAVSNIATVSSGYWGAGERTATTSEPVNVLRNGDIRRDGSISGTASRWFTQREAERAAFQVGDLALTSSGDCGKATLISKQGLFASNFVKRIRITDSEIMPHWLFFILQSSDTTAVMKTHIAGSTIQNLRKPFFGERYILAPPLPEQEHIVEILEEQFSRLDSALEVANQLEVRIATERRSLLHSAFTGELTAHWRATHV